MKECLMIFLSTITEYHNNALLYKVCIILVYSHMSMYEMQIMMYNDDKFNN